MSPLLLAVLVLRGDGSLSAPLHGSTHDVGPFRLSPDGHTVAYGETRGTAPDLARVYTVPVSGALPVTPIHDRIAPGATPAPRFDSTGHWLFFCGGDLDHGTAVFRAPADGSAPATLLSDVDPQYGPVRLYTSSPDGAHVAFATVDYFVFTATWMAPGDGSGPPVHIGASFGMQFTLDSQHLVLSSPTLRSFPAGGGPETVLTQPGSDRTIGTFQLTASSDALYLSSADPSQIELFRVPVDGSAAPTKLSGTLAAGGSVGLDFRIVPDETSVVYTADVDGGGVQELFRASIEGNMAPVLLSGGLGLELPRGRRGTPPFEVSPDGSRVVFVAEQAGDGQLQLYSVPIDGTSPPVRLNGPLVTGGNVDYVIPTGQSSPAWPGFHVSPDGTRVAYRADQAIDECHELFVVPIDGQEPAVRLHAPLGGALDVEPAFTFTHDSTRVLFRSDLALDGRTDLWMATLDGSRPPKRLSRGTNPGYDVGTELLVTPGDGYVLFLSDATIFHQVELFRSPLGRAAPVAEGPGGR